MQETLDSILLNDYHTLFPTFAEVVELADTLP